MATHRTRQQQRAIDGHRLVGSRFGADGKSADWKKYRTFCKKGPTLLQQSGVMQTVAFCLSRDDAGAKHWVADLAELLGKSDLAQVAREAPLAQYLALSRDAIEAATWLRRFAMSLDPEVTE